MREREGWGGKTEAERRKEGRAEREIEREREREISSLTSSAYINPLPLHSPLSYLE